jgi:hypothetical protein
VPNLIQDTGRAAFCQAGINWNSDTIKAVIVDNTYTYSSAHQFLSDVTSGARIATTTLAGASSTSGILNATSPITWTSVTNANQLTGFWIYKDTGTASTSTLIAWIDGTIRITIAATSTTSTAITTDPLSAAIGNSAVLTRISGTGPSSVTLGASGGGAANARALTAASAQSMVQGDVYTAPTSGSNFPISAGLSSATINFNIDSGTNKIAKI